MNRFPNTSLARRAGVATLALSALCAWAADEEPFWAVGRPKSPAVAKMEPVPAFPIPTAADKLPVAKLKLPPGF